MITAENTGLHDQSVVQAMKGTADLGLFAQLLQMVDGEWSDSIHAICSHVHERFSALGVSLSIFDRVYDEFIYVAYSINKHDVIRKLGVDINVNTAVELLRVMYDKNPAILEERIFSGQELCALVEDYFGGGEAGTGEVMKELNLRAIAAFPILETRMKYKCYFHVLSDRDIDEREMRLLNEYVPQLNVALEIVFLVRELYIKATHDGLTRLFNHRQGESLLDREIERVKRNRLPLTVVMLDLDDFKKVNDTYGHDKGDEVLRFMGELLARSLRKSDIVCRYGGEEFLLVLTETRPEIACDVLSRIRKNIQSHVFAAKSSSFSVTASFGVSVFDPLRHEGAADVIREADGKLYLAKQMGKNRIES